MSGYLQKIPVVDGVNYVYRINNLTVAWIV